ncbi:CalY family protein [Halobacteria archaeon HArc-gm2]|nr:CalY family protein [Halobacteria archaeon HArc-gm2]
MNGKDIELSRRRVLGGIATVGAASAAAGAGTFAYFSDTETSDGNTINAGTLDLGSSTGGTISLSNAVPGDTTSVTVTSTYSGSVDAEVDVDFSVAEDTITENSEPTSNSTELNATEFAEYLEVTEASVDIGSTPHEEDLLSSVSDTNGNSLTDLADLVSAASFDSVTGNNVTDGEDVSVTLSLTFDENAGNDAQADGVDITIDLIAEQSGRD